MSTIAVGGRHEQVQNGGLAAAGATHQGVAAAGLQVHVHVVQHGLARLVGEVQVPDRDALCELRFDGLPLVGDVLAERLGQLVDEAVGGLLSGVIRGEDLDGRENVVEQLHEHDGGAGGDAAPAGQGQSRRHKEHAELQSAPC